MEETVNTNRSSAKKRKLNDLDTSSELDSKRHSSFRIVRQPNLPFPNYRQPKQIGFYSLDEQRRYVANGSQVKYLFMPDNIERVSFDLNTGYQDAVHKDFGTDEGMDSILKWLLGNKKMLLGASNTLQTDFVCYRGLLTKILCTPYENQDDWIICAIKYRETIFLCGFKTERDIERHVNQTERDKLMSAWGYKFEQYMMSEEMGKPPDVKKPVNEKAEYNCVVRTRLEKHSLIFGAEVDGLDTRIDVDYPEKTGKTDGYIELKTSRMITHPRQKDNFARFKLIKWWCQSYLVGIRKIYCGFRDDDGIVRKIEPFKTDAIPMIGERHWAPNVCMNFCNEFLSYVKSVITNNDPRCVYKFYWTPRQNHVTWENVTEERFRFLRDWFIQDF